MALRDFVTIIRELSLDQIRGDALLAPRLLVIAADAGHARDVASALFGVIDPYVDTCAGDCRDVDPLAYDVIVSVGPLPNHLARTWNDLFRRANEELRLVEVPADRVLDPAAIDTLRRRIVERAGDRVLSLGRHIPLLKSVAAERVIGETSTVNGQFALVSNVPAVIPVVGNLVAAGADLVVLTKNQLLMVFKLAAIYDRDLHDRSRIFGEMIPVVGAGFAWRTIARELAALLPLAAGTVPKVAIAYAGTWAMGRAARVYYERGERLSPNQFRALYADALGRLRRQPITAPRRGGVDETDAAD